MDKKKFLVIVDYSHGGFGFIVYAYKKDDLELALNTGGRDRGIKIIDKDIEEHPLVQYLGEKIEFYDLNNPDGLLKSLMST